MRHNNATAPMILYSYAPHLHLGQCDCDCACTLELPAVLAAQPAFSSYDCDCACALEFPRTLIGELASAAFDCDCACALDLPRTLNAELAAAAFDCDCACALNVPRTLAGEQAAASFDCDCACSLDVPQSLSGQAMATAFDCDCACASDPAHDQRVRPMAAAWVQQARTLPIPLEEGWQAYFNPNGPVGVAVLNSAAQRVLAAFEAPSRPRTAVEHLGMSLDVAKAAFVNLAEIGLLHPVEMPVAPADDSPILSAWLHITEACNLNCPYCYVHKRPNTMSVEVGREAVDLLVEMAGRYGHTTLKLKYAGGEPTLRFNLVQAIHEHAVRRTTEAGLTLEEVVLSNGVGMSDETLDFMAEAAIKLMVSLDGGPDTHDLVRARRDGKSTYAAVTDTVERAMARGLRPNISITLTALNLDGAADAVAFALERGLPFNLNFYRECAGGDPDGKTPPLTPNPIQLTDTMLRILALIRDFPSYPLPLTGILDRTRLDVPHSHACSAGRDYLAFNATGQISACQMLLEEPWADLSDDDPLGAIRQQGKHLFTPVEEQPDCNTCAWSAACSGGCPLMRETVMHDEYCHVYQALFPELIRVEARRLIAHQSSVVQ